LDRFHFGLLRRKIIVNGSANCQPESTDKFFEKR
jgi:hypothetical protein